MQDSLQLQRDQAAALPQKCSQDQVLRPVYFLPYTDIINNDNKRNTLDQNVGGGGNKKRLSFYL